MIDIKNLYRHKHPEFHQKLGFGVLVEKVSCNKWMIRWINTGKIVAMHPNWLEAIYESG